MTNTLNRPARVRWRALTVEVDRTELGHRAAAGLEVENAELRHLRLNAIRRRRWQRARY